MFLRAFPRSFNSILVRLKGNFIAVKIGSYVVKEQKPSVYPLSCRNPGGSTTLKQIACHILFKTNDLPVCILQAAERINDD